MIFCKYCRDCLYEKAKDIYSRRGAENAVRFTGTRRSDFSREHRQFATKVAPTDYRIPCVPCASARKQDVELPAKTGFSVKCKPTTTVRSSLNYYS